ncbi:hypothetical protein [Burkholderia vietnamiensis]|jgi:hypothetical protein|uniref:hypothetical protein n=1 Tax=Burkholderia cepacia complex TaxID=87882 RepID=UPI001B97930E|nr:hypothetical protein [Burkholderia vietnamiensis]MBR8082988.1 hypothetical protein [Burkholderia vietnamiensis]
MKERPILFSGPMVRATLEGRKTQTRRVMKHQPPDDVAPITVARYHPTIVDRHGDEAPGPEIFGAFSDDGEWGCKSPFGEPGDRLWVREAFRFTSDFDGDSPTSVGGRCLDAGYRTPWAPVRYEVDGAERDWRWVGTPPGHEVTAGRARASMHMPRWASRITLEITRVHAERLQAISESDARAEGVTIEEHHMRGYCAGACRPPSIRAFHDLWDSLNAARGHGWDANPWVWAIEFRRIEP